MKLDWIDLLPRDIVDHRDGCTCPRCEGFEKCPVCGRIKLDIDWCFNCRRLVLGRPWHAYRELKAARR